ncbi:hypothetical protein ABK040_015705 [Willaertia magna]
MLETLQTYIDFTEKNFLIAALVILITPIIWNILARIEFYTHLLTKLACGNAKLGCYALAVYIFSFSLFRDYLYSRALEAQPTFLKEEYGSQALIIGYIFQGLGMILVVSSMYRLGVTGTYLGDYFGILMDDRVTSFPFNVTDNPMYNGSTLTFIGHAIVACSPAGLLLAIEVYVMYRIALLFEEPFTAYIYQKRELERSKKSSSSSASTTPSSTSQKKKSLKLE